MCLFIMVMFFFLSINIFEQIVKTDHFQCTESYKLAVLLHTAEYKD